MKGQYVIDDISAAESWRMFRMMAEFVDGFEAMAHIFAKDERVRLPVVK